MRKRFYMRRIYMTSYKYKNKSGLRSRLRTKIFATLRRLFISVKKQNFIYKKIFKNLQKTVDKYFFYDIIIVIITDK